jgi:hypothetical protein
MMSLLHISALYKAIIWEVQVEHILLKMYVCRVRMYYQNTDKS